MRSGGWHSIPPWEAKYKKLGPAVIVSNNAANAVLNRLIVVPLTSQTAKVYPGEALVALNGETRKAMADQLTTASKKRLRSKLGELSVSDVTAVEAAILLQLGIRR